MSTTLLLPTATPVMAVSKGGWADDNTIDNYFPLPNYDHLPIQISLDAEWRGMPSPLGAREQIEAMICSQYILYYPCSRTRRVIILHENVRNLEFKPDLNLTDVMLDEGFDEIIWANDEQIHNGLIHLLGVEGRKIDLLMYASPIDFIYLLGFDNTLAFFSSKTIVKKRGYKINYKRSGKVVLTIPHPSNDESKAIVINEIRDLAGLNSAGLESACQSVGIQPKSKSKSRKWDKSRMDLVFISEPDNFIKYALNDTDLLRRYLDGVMNLVNKTRREFWGLRNWKIRELPHTTGSIVAKCFLEWLEKRIPGLALARIMTGRWNGTNAKARESIEAVINKLKAGEEPEGSAIKKALSFIDHSDCLTGAGIVDLCTNFISDSGKYGAIVQGGRCVNERPFENVFKGRFADIDLSSCYGSALRQFKYPIGLPTVYRFAEGNTKESRLNLGQFLDQYDRELMEGLYHIVVSGFLEFDQDFIASKTVKEADLKKAAAATFDEDATESTDLDETDHSKIPGDFVVLLREIENGIVTSEVLKVLRAVATNQEMAGFKKLKVISAVIYPKSKQMSVERYVEACLDYYKPVTIERRSNEIKGNLVDDRFDGWCCIDIEEFIGALVDKRKGIKEQAKTDASLKALDNMLKLFVNTLYGVIASPYFPIGNSVVANNITAKARVGAWMMAKPLHLVQTITDGGAYNIDCVRSLELGTTGKRPGFNRLARSDQWLDIKSGRGFKSLEVIIEGIDPWSDPNWFLGNSGRVGKFLDKQALKHVNEFWGNYNLCLPFDVEHKGSNCSKAWAWGGKGDYAYMPLMIEDEDGKYKINNSELAYKVRGTRNWPKTKKADTQARILTEEEGFELLNYKRHPKYDMFDNLLLDSDIPITADYIRENLLSSNTWLKSTKKDRIIPGQSMVGRCFYELTLTHLPFDTVEEYKLFSTGKVKISQSLQLELMNDPINMPKELNKFKDDRIAKRRAHQ